MRRIILLVLCGLPCLGGPVKAQVNQHAVRLLPLMHGEGLSSNRVTSIIQDRQGYIWFGTEDGLNRYNGQEIKVFRHVPGDSTSLSSNSVTRMLVDRRGLLWIAAKGSGLNCYNPVTGTFRVYRPAAGDAGALPSDQVHFLLESRRGLLLARREVVKRERLRGDLRVKQVESEKWQELDTLKYRFFANISHEFRTPLTLITGTVDDLLGEDQNGNHCRPQHVLIQRNARRLLQLINQLLDLSKLEAGCLQPDARAGNLTAFLKMNVQAFAYLAESRGIGYATRVPDAACRARFDPDKLEKVLNNLLSNALKFTPGGGRVEVTAAVEPLPDRAACRLTVVVSDNGIGIAPGSCPTFLTASTRPTIP